jgi:8-oxo-dGTP pyrophosphatase MutT (NUDIX family)
VPETDEPGARGSHPNIRSKDAASIILLDRSRASPRVLMGLRSKAHAFMPGLYVFPGGRRDAGDHALPFSRDLAAQELAKLSLGSTRPLSPAGARALALAAARELQEETGLLLGSDAARHGPDLSRLRFLARAITPPGHIRRYDTRFFCCFTDEVDIDPSAFVDSDELHDLQWLDITRNSSLNMPAITRMVLEDVTNIMIGDPSLESDSPVRHYFVRRGRFIRGFL